MPKRLVKRLYQEHPDDLIRLHVAEPAPIGLFGLALGCLILMCVDFELTSGKLMLIPWIFLLPATLQLIAGVFDFLRHNVFGGTAFIGYSVFWYGLSWVYYLEINYENHSNIDQLLPSQPTIRQHTGVIACGYLIFSILLSIIALGVNRTLFSILLAIDFTFLMLILHIFTPDSIPSYVVAIGLIFVFLTSFYGFIAILLLKIARGEVLPIGKAYIDWSDYIITDIHASRSIIKSYDKKDEDFNQEEYVDMVAHSINGASGSISNIQHNELNVKNRSKSNNPRKNYYVPMTKIKTSTNNDVD